MLVNKYFYCFLKSTASTFCFFLLQSLLSSHALANTLADKDTTKPAFSIGLKSHYGFIIPHSESIKRISFSKPWGAELDLSWHLADNQSWQYFYSYPRVGVAVSYINFGNPAVLGSGLTTVAYAEPFLAAQNKFSFSFRLGTGLAFLNKVYDAIKNPTNLFYSTPLSFVMMANAGINYRLNPHLMVRLSGYYNHISNGGTKEPNKGINFPTLSIGLDYTVIPVEFRQRTPEEWSRLHTQKTRYKVALMGITKTAFPGDRTRYPLYGVTGYVSHVVGRINAFTTGLEWVSDGSLREKIRQSDTPDISHRRAALTVGHEFLIGKFTFSQQLGLYLYCPYPARDPVYQRIGLEYKLTNHLFMGTNLKTHRQVADFLDLRLGYTF
jgi:hypothetical protein